MDNITHSLAGFALAESGLKRTTPLATLTLVVAANLPDLDGLSYLLGNSTDGLAVRRGWTHGVVAMMILPLVLTVILLGWARLRKRPDVRPGWLLLLATIGVGSHPLLDWLNTYGVRLLMPFSSHWFYGDALFIVDPWIWLVLGLGIVLSRRRARALDPVAAGRPARIALGLTAGYALMMAAATRAAVDWIGRHEGPARRVLAAPVFGDPLRRDVIRELDSTYELGRISLAPPWRYVRVAEQSTGREAPGAAQAAETRTGAVFLRWARFPRFESEPMGEIIRVTISDLRYGGRGNRSWASVSVEVPAGDAAHESGPGGGEPP